MRLEPLEDRRLLDAGTLFVDAVATGGATGEDWTNAYTDLQPALSAAETLNTDADPANDVAAIWLAEGTYRPTEQLEADDVRTATFSLVTGVSLVGGFAGTETTPDERAIIDGTFENETILSGDLGTADETSDNAYTVVYAKMASGTETTLDGLTITAGNANGPLDASHRENKYGGGIYNSGTLTVVNSTINENSAESGGGIYNSGTSTVTNSIFNGNSTGSAGGGIFNRGRLTVANSVFSGNSALSTGGGIFNSSSSFSVTNSTISGNSAAIGGGGVYSPTLYDSGQVVPITVVNSIVGPNDSPDEPGIDGSNITQSSLIGIDPGFVRKPSDGSDGWVDDPATPDVDESANNDYGDLRLTATSIAVNAGDNSLVIPEASGVDLDGNERIVGDAVDIGAFEFQGEPADGDAASTVVTTLEDVVDWADGDISIREAVVHATMGGLATPITFDAALSRGTIVLDGAPIWLDGDVQIDASTAGEIVVDADGHGRVFMMAAGASVELVSLHITGGSALAGGGIYNSGELTIVDSTVSANSVAGVYYGDDPTGAGVFNVGTLTVINSTFSENSAEGRGGGIYTRDGTLTVIDSTFSGNSTEDRGGAIYTGSGTLTVIDSTFDGNSAEGDGGAIYTRDGTLVVSGSTFSENAGPFGGAIYSYRSTSTISDSIFTRNSASSGGAILVSHSGWCGVTSSTFNGNSATDAGGAFATYHWTTLTIANSIISGNKAVDGGGIINRLYSELTVRNSTITANVGIESGGGIYNDGNSESVVKSSIVAANDSPGRVQIVGTYSDSYSLLAGEPGFLRRPFAGPDGVWGTVDDDYGDLRLRTGSPAIDAGANYHAVAAAGAPLATDILGNPRIQNGTVDIGAIEGGGVSLPAATYLVESLDLAIAADGVLSFGEAFAAANMNAPSGDAPGGSFAEVDRIEFVEGLSGAIVLDGEQLTIAGRMEINGPGADLITIDGNHQSRVVHVLFGATVGIAGLAITGGVASGDGGGILNEGELTLQRVVVSANSATETGGGIGNVPFCTVSGYNMPGVCDGGEVTIVGSTVSGNVAGTTGGGIDNRGVLAVANSTISGNSAVGGGGVLNYDATATLEFVTIADNEVTADGGGVMNVGVATIRLDDTIVAGNRIVAGQVPDDVSGQFDSAGGYNLIGAIDGSAGLDSFGTIYGTASTPMDPVLRTLADNGGPTLTHALANGSPAIDAGGTADVPTDQRGLERPVDGLGDGIATNDIGAFEYAPSVIGSYLCYRGSAFDDGAGDGAIAVDRLPLIGGRAAAAVNYSNFVAGINGVVIDFDRADDGYAFSADDFVFRVGNDDNVNGWAPAPSPSFVGTRPGAGVADSIRVDLAWDDGSIVDTWLEVTVLANGNTGLPADHVFYFGSVVGEVTGVGDLRSGDSAGSGGPRRAATLVNAADVVAIRDRSRGESNPAPIDDPFDVNRDRAVDALDLILARNNAASPLSAVRLITPEDGVPVVTGRYLFYNGSSFDGGDREANELDDAAIATDKVALLPGEAASFANYSSYSAGINGVAIDVVGLADLDLLSLDDFSFRTGNGDDKSLWNDVSVAPSLSIREEASKWTGDRLTLTWPDGTITNTWLEIMLRATPTTGLVDDHVFYFGNAIGEVTGGGDLRSGDSAGSGDPRRASGDAGRAMDALVNAADVVAVRDNPRGVANRAAVDDAHDINRDMRVDALDTILARNAATSPLAVLKPTTAMTNEQ